MFHTNPGFPPERNSYLPEGSLLSDPRNTEYRSSVQGLERAMREDRIIEAPVLLCDSWFRLHLELGPGITGIIEREESVLTREGESIKDIAVLTRVGKASACKVLSIGQENGRTVVRLSRRAAQRECMDAYLSRLSPGDIIPAKVTHLEPFGAFCDVGCGVVSLLSVDCISVSRISHPRDRLSPGDRIMTVVKSVDRMQDPHTVRLFLTMKELLGTWEENASCFLQGQTVAGIVRSVENYGVFVELAPNLAGLAERTNESSATPLPAIGQPAAVYIKSILPERMKVKLVLIDSCHSDGERLEVKKPLRYFINFDETRHLSSFRYSPASCRRVIETVFDES